MKVRRTVTISAAAVAALSRKSVEVDEAVAEESIEPVNHRARLALLRESDHVDLRVIEARITLANDSAEEVLELIAARFPDIALKQIKGLRTKIRRIFDDVVTRTIMVEQLGPDQKKQRARSRGRRGGAVRSNQSRKKMVLELAKKIDAGVPGLSLNQLAKRVVESLPGVEQTTVRRYLARFRGGA